MLNTVCLRENYSVSVLINTAPQPLIKKYLNFQHKPGNLNYFSCQNVVTESKTFSVPLTAGHFLHMPHLTSLCYSNF